MKNDTKTLRFFLDTEFNEHAKPFAIDPISLALVPDNASRDNFYGVSSDFDASKITPWLQENVVVHLPPTHSRIPNSQLRDRIISYLQKFGCADASKIEIWTYNGATDQVVLASFFGGLMGLRNAFKKAGLPKVEFRDTKELLRATSAILPPPKNAHDCLVDAIWTRKLFHTCVSKLKKSHRYLVE